MPRIDNKKRGVYVLCLLCCLAYGAGYLTRINFSAVLVDIMDDLNITKDVAGIAVTGTFITYAVGQLLSGFIGDKIAPRRMIALGLFFTSAVNLLMPVSPNITWMTVMWCFNGFFQSMLWPPIVRIMAEHLDVDGFYAKAIVYVSSATSLATILVRCLIAPVSVHLAGWRPVFYIGGGAGMVILLLWLVGTRNLSKEGKAVPVAVDNAPKEAAVGLKPLVVSGVAVAMIAIVCLGLLKDGVDTWMPVYIKEVFGLGNSISIFTSAILPVFAIFSVSVATVLHRIIKNELKTAALMFALAAVTALLILPFFSASVILTALLMAVIMGCMMGVSLMLISRVPAVFKRYGKVSTISGVLNACAYLGSTMSAYGFAKLSQIYGWYFIIITWAVIAAVGAVVCACCIKRWEKFTKQ